MNNTFTYGAYPCNAFAALPAAAAAANGAGKRANAAAAAAAAGYAARVRPLCIATPRNAAAAIYILFKF